MSSHIIIKNMLNNCTTTPENYRALYLRSDINVILMMVSRCANIAKRSSRVLMPSHRPVGAFPRSITTRRATMRAGMQHGM